MAKVRYNRQIMKKSVIYPIGHVFEIADSEVDKAQKDGAVLVTEKPVPEPVSEDVPRMPVETPPADADKTLNMADVAAMKEVESADEEVKKEVESKEPKKVSVAEASTPTTKKRGRPAKKADSE